MEGLYGFKLPGTHIIMGVMQQVLIQIVCLLLGNDLAGHKFMGDLRVISQSFVDPKVKELHILHLGTFPEGIVAWSRSFENI